MFHSMFCPLVLNILASRSPDTTLQKVVLSCYNNKLYVDVVLL